MVFRYPLTHKYKSALMQWGKNVYFAEQIMYIYLEFKLQVLSRITPVGRGYSGQYSLNNFEGVVLVV